MLLLKNAALVVKMFRCLFDAHFRPYSAWNQDIEDPNLWDVWLNPMFADQSFIDIFNPDGKLVEERFGFKQEVNCWETHMTVKYLVIFVVALPLMTGFGVMPGILLVCC